MTKSEKKREKQVEADEILEFRPSGEVQINWEKAIRSPLLKEQIDSLKEIEVAEG